MWLHYLVFQRGFLVKISAHFTIFKSGRNPGKVGLWSDFRKIGELFGTRTDVLGEIFGHLPTLCPLSKYGFDHDFGDLTIEKSSVYAGLRVFRIRKAHLPTFFLKLL